MNFSCRKVELIDLADLIILGEFFGTANHNLTRKDFAEYGVFHCASYPIHWLFPMIGFVVVSFQAYLGADQSEQFKQKLGTKLEDATITYNIYYINLVDSF